MPTDDPALDTIHIGTSGFSYADWRGTFYPPTIRDSQMLSFYADRFKTTELNATFYNLPAVPSLVGMLNKVSDDFRFAVKGHRDLTHYLDKARETLPRFRETLRVIGREGKLGPVLLQFPAAFIASPEHRDHVRWLADELKEQRVVMEFRHVSWMDEGTPGWLRELNAGFCVVDLPEVGWLPSAQLWVTAPTAYIRFHGRNTEKWRAPATRNERYDYRYSDAELEDWVPKVAEMAEQAEHVYVYYNNHFRGQAPANAERFRELLSSYIRGKLSKKPRAAVPSADGTR
jgi:uncharacterized protein YecE (DUF72 family)